jgi:hypothetical protein
MNLTTTLDMELQEYGEKLMSPYVGSMCGPGARHRRSTCPGQCTHYPLICWWDGVLETAFSNWQPIPESPFQPGFDGPVSSRFYL